MKNSFSFWLILTILMVSTRLLHAQAVSAFNKETAAAVYKDTVAQLTKFEGKHVEGVTYLHWSVENQHVSGTYIVYRSIDSLNYSIIGYKQGIGVPVSIPIAYYFQDKYPFSGTTYYRLVHFSKDKTCLISDVITVRTGLPVLSRTQ